MSQRIFNTCRRLFFGELPSSETLNSPVVNFPRNSEDESVDSSEVVRENAESGRNEVAAATIESFRIPIFPLEVRPTQDALIQRLTNDTTLIERIRNESNLEIVDDNAARAFCQEKVYIFNLHQSSHSIKPFWGIFDVMLQLNNY